jgi:hypothetical protein
MGKVAKLVAVSFITRVVVDDTMSDEEILESCKESLKEKVNFELSENLEYIEDDEDCPYELGEDLAAEDLELIKILNNLRD